MNVLIYSFVVTAFVLMQLNVEWIKYQQRKSETNIISIVNNKNEFVLQKSGLSVASNNLAVHFITFTFSKIVERDRKMTNGQTQIELF